MVNEIQTPKPINDCSEENKKIASMNAKAMNILYCVISNRIVIIIKSRELSFLHIAHNFLNA